MEDMICHYNHEDSIISHNNLYRGQINDSLRTTGLEIIIETISLIDTT